jgi:short-subunit dehydrogenase
MILRKKNRIFLIQTKGLILRGGLNIFILVHMNDIRDAYGDWCLVAGAAEGLGEAWSAALAVRGMNLIMVDNQGEKMQVLAERLEREFGIQIRQIELDLGAGDPVDRMMDAIGQTRCRLIVYNAAFSRVRRFADNPEADLDRYTRVNIRTPIFLVHRFVRYHSARPEPGKGIILMASLAGLWGTRFLAPYGASKAFNLVLAEALHHELKPANFDVMACVAGATATPAYMGTQPHYGRIRTRVMDPGQVAEEALRKLGRRAVFIPGFRNRFTYFLMTRILSRRTSARLFNRVIGGMYPGL